MRLWKKSGKPEPKRRKYRLSWDEYFLAISEVVALRADCTRRTAGAVIVKDNRIVATGYNGAPADAPGCLEGACPRGRHYPASANRCGCGNTWPCPESVIPAASSYDSGAGRCIAIHAEANALLYASRDKCEGATLYTIPGEPCEGCWKLIKGAGIKQVIWPRKGAEIKYVMV